MEMETKICGVCGKEITGRYMQASVDKDLKPTEKGAVVCSEACAREYETKLPYQGKPIGHFSRITGYYQNIDGWNNGKKQELKDRRRYGIHGGDVK
ncbi:MAG: anaerobic ribonucleoside-triphosphate reductase [Candidatus Altiarchaeota archaeon]|nr:anaerobic ribonucleoside-triphosphate reductase [Candidatus Altiarchaeota archaeon]